jgi:hypothetical protein
VEDGGGYCSGNTMAFHPTNSGLLYVGGSYYDYVAQTTYMAVGKTTDQGGSWTFAYLTADYGDVYALAIDPTNPQNIYAGGYHSAGTRLFKSTDGGSSWAHISGSVNATVEAIAVDPTAPSTVYCGNYHGLYKSTNGGSSWAQRSTFDVNSIVLAPTRSMELYTAGDEGAHNSTDGGTTWAEISDGLDDLDVWALAAHPATVGVVFAGTGGGGVFEFAKQAYVGVTSPAPGDQWMVGDTEQIQWSSWGTSGTVAIEISRDGGSTWSTVVPTFPDIGTHAWTVTGPASANCVMRVADTDGDPSGLSGTFAVSEAYISVTSPAAGSDWPIGSSQHIQWGSAGTSGTVSIELSRDGGGTWTTIEPGTPDDGDHLWNVTGPAAVACVIRVTDADGTPAGQSGTFSISDAPYVTVITPAAGAMWEMGTSQLVLWGSMGTSGTVDIAVSRDAGASWATIEPGTPDDGDYLWTVTGPASQSCIVRVCDTDGAPEGLSGTFTIYSTAADDPLAPETVAIDVLGENPTGGPISLVCSLPDPGHVSVTVHDVHGRRVETLHIGWLPAGEHVFLSRGALSPGLHVCRLEACGTVASTSLVVVR